MAGKRPDQHNIAPGEAGATDYKFNPQTTHGTDGDLTEMREGDKQRLQESRSGGQPFLPDVPSPSAEANRAANREDTDAEDVGPAAAETRTGKESPLA